MKSKLVTILGIILGIVIILFVGLFIWYSSSLKPVKKASTQENVPIRVEIKEGMGLSGIANLLEENNVIKSAFATKLYAKVNNISNLKAGKYDLDNTENTQTILEHIVNGEIANDEVKITFIEGKNMRWIAKTIANSTENTEEDVFKLLEDEEYIDSLIEKYWFITDDIENIFSVILDYTEKFLNNYKKDIENSDFTIHEILTLASLAELEGESTEDRAEIVGVFLNRLSRTIPLGSDVSTYYAFKIDMGERNLTKKELNTENPYNTRGPNMAGKIPVGPICNPSKSAIEATLHYKETDAFYFVADKNKKVYFTKTENEHNKKIQELKDEGLWYVYE